MCGRTAAAAARLSAGAGPGSARTKQCDAGPFGPRNNKSPSHSMASPCLPESDTRAQTVRSHATHPNLAGSSAARPGARHGRRRLPAPPGSRRGEAAPRHPCSPRLLMTALQNPIRAWSWLVVAFKLLCSPSKVKWRSRHRVAHFSQFRKESEQQATERKGERAAKTRTTSPSQKPPKSRSCAQQGQKTLNTC